MKIEAVIVCQNYGDFLAHTLPENINHFDRLVVVTHPDDKETIDVCNRFSVDCVKTTEMHSDGDKFNKGRCINLGLGHLRGMDWILHLDADIVLPHRFRDMLHRTKLDKNNIYGADRMNVYGHDHWVENKHKLIPHYSNGYFVEPKKEFPMGARIIHHELGYTPIGYFQLWHKSLGRRYPINQGNAEHTDVLFAVQWPRANRILLPEVVVCHLESEAGPQEMGKNWDGRTTRRFGPHRHHHHCHGYNPHRHHCHCHKHHHKEKK